MNLFLFGFTKTGIGAKAAHQAPILGDNDRWAPQLISRVTLATVRGRGGLSYPVKGRGQNSIRSHASSGPHIGSTLLF